MKHLELKSEIIIFFHTLWYTFVFLVTFNLVVDHRRCSVTETVKGEGFPEKVVSKRVFCSCGYLNNGVTWSQELEKIKVVDVSKTEYQKV